MRVAIVGTRTFKSAVLFDDAMKRYIEKDDMVVTGDAEGADAFAREFAASMKKDIIVFKARWDEYGIRAGPMRNQKIVDAADKMIAFWDGASKGTLDSIERAKKKGISLIVIRV